MQFSKTLSIPVATLLALANFVPSEVHAQNVQEVSREKVELQPRKKRKEIKLVCVQEGAVVYQSEDSSINKFNAERFKASRVREKEVAPTARGRSEGAKTVEAYLYQPGNIICVRLKD